MALLRAREQDKRSHRVIQNITHEAGNNTTFTPIEMGPSTVAFLRSVDARAAAGKFKMAQQPEMKYTWNTIAASSLGHAPERGLHGDGRGVPEPHHNL